MATKKGTSAKKISGTKTKAVSKRKLTQKKETKRFTFNKAFGRFLGIGIFFLFSAAILLLSLLSPQGSLTTPINRFLSRGFGFGRYILPFLLGSAGIYFVLTSMDSQPSKLLRRIVAGLLFFVSIESLASIWLVMREPLDYQAVAREGWGGGYVGAIFGNLIAFVIGDLGSFLVYSLFAIVAILIFFAINPAQIAEWVLDQISQFTQPAPPDAQLVSDLPSVLRRLGGRELQRDREPSQSQNARPKRKARKRSVSPDAEQDHNNVRPPSRMPAYLEDKLPVSARSDDPAPSNDQMQSTKKKEEKRPAQQRKTFGSDGSEEMTADEKPLSPTNTPIKWHLPDLTEILNPGYNAKADEAQIEDHKAILLETLNSFGAPGQIVETQRGPTVTQYGYEPGYIYQRNGTRKKVKVSKIANLADDLALALAAKSVRIQAPVPGKGYVGIEVPSSAKVLVSLRDVMESPGFGRIKSPLRIGLGQDVAGNAISADLAKMPHLLIAGATGSGKSVCVNAIIACLLLQNSPNELRLVMVDPKRVELTGYNGIPHLATPVVVEMDKVIGVLMWALREMDSRYQKFAKIGARNIETYNKKMAKQDGEKLEYIVIIIDELADLMMTAPEDTERALARLAQMARATGMHMIIATQRPSVDVVTGLIKANFPARIAFAVSSSTDSRVILDQVGAERLLGQGDMLLQKPDSAEPVRMQGCYVSDGELDELIAWWKEARQRRVYGAADIELKPLNGNNNSNNKPVPPPSRQPIAPSKPKPVSNPKVAKATRPSAPTSAKKPIVEKQPSQPPIPIKPSRPKFKLKPIKPVTEAESPMPEPVVIPTPEMPEPTIIEPVNLIKPEPIKTDTIHTGPLPRNNIKIQPLLDVDEEKRAHEADELWDEAVAFVRKTGSASTSMLQRKFRIGYTRSARMIDMMEDVGIIGPPTGTSRARDVLT